MNRNRSPIGRQARMRGTVGLILLALGALVLASCTGSSGDGPSEPTASTSEGAPATAATTAAPASPAPIPAGFQTVTGATYQFGLPTTVTFAVDSERVTDEGGLVKRWRYAVTPTGPYCVVVATEQANFNGQFPESVVQLFAANTQPEQHTLRNEVMRPNPPGTIGGVDQESTFLGRLDDGSTFDSHFYQRKYLTPGRSLIALSVGGPEANSAACQYAAIIGSFSATGQEFTPATPGPSTADADAGTDGPSPTEITS
jgi:hypothetical protein